MKKKPKKTSRNTGDVVVIGAGRGGGGGGVGRQWLVGRLGCRAEDVLQQDLGEGQGLEKDRTVGYIVYRMGRAD